MASTIKEILLFDFCNLLSFSAFEVEEALQLLISFLIFPFDIEFLLYSYWKSCLRIR